MTIGFSNFSAGSDLLRHAIMYYKGGYYCDTDLQFKYQPSAKHKADKPFFGFRCNVGLAGGMPNKSFSHLATDNDFQWLNGDFLAAIPRHKVFEIIITNILKALKELDETKTTCRPGTNCDFQTDNRMDSKRWPFYSIKQPSDGSRFILTMASTGPYAVMDAFTAYFNDLGKNYTFNMSDILSMNKNRSEIIPGVNIIYNCAQSWLNTFDNYSLIFLKKPPKDAEFKRAPIITKEPLQLVQYDDKSRTGVRLNEDELQKIGAAYYLAQEPEDGANLKKILPPKILKKLDAYLKQKSGCTHQKKPQPISFDDTNLDRPMIQWR